MIIVKMCVKLNECIIFLIVSFAFIFWIIFDKNMLRQTNIYAISETLNNWGRGGEISGFLIYMCFISKIQLDKGIIFFRDFILMPL